MPARYVRTRLLAAGAALSLAVVTAGSVSSSEAAGPRQSAAPPDLSGLQVLLTNDDSAQGRDANFGTDGKGLYELRKALCAAGADVLVVAPWQQQSGAGARMTVPGFSPVSITVQAVTPPSAYAGDCASSDSGGAVFGVCVAATACDTTTPTASPADAVNVALSRFARQYWPQGPDVVLSGVNFGQNVGTTLNHSGTVGAAVTASEYDVPALAFSAEVPRDLAQIPNTPFRATATFALDLLDELIDRRALAPGLVLNVNHPFVGSSEQLGKPTVTVAGSSSDLGLTFTGDVPPSGGTYRLTPGAPETETRSGADTTALARNDISITPLDGDWTASPLVRARIAMVVAGLR